MKQEIMNVNWYKVNKDINEIQVFLKQYSTMYVCSEDELAWGRVYDSIGTVSWDYKYDRWVWHIFFDVDNSFCDRHNYIYTHDQNIPTEIDSKIRIEVYRNEGMMTFCQIQYFINVPKKIKKQQLENHIIVAPIR